MYSYIFFYISTNYENIIIQFVSQDSLLPLLITEECCVNRNDSKCNFVSSSILSP